MLGTGGQPRFSRDAIAEFQFISNRFDATQGRSSGVQVNAISKSGTNNFDGLVPGAVPRRRASTRRTSSTDRVLPYSNQQSATTLGGPIVRDRCTSSATSSTSASRARASGRRSTPSFNVALDGKSTRKIGGGRVDYQISPQTRFMAKAHGGRSPSRRSPRRNANHPASTNDTKENSKEFLGQLTSVLNSAAVNELKVGRAEFGLANKGLTDVEQPLAEGQRHHDRCAADPVHRLQHRAEPEPPAGTHAGRVERARRLHVLLQRRRPARRAVRLRVPPLPRADGQLPSLRGCRSMPAAARARPTSTRCFPDPFNVDTWNLNALSSITRSYTLGLGNFPIDFTQPKIGAWWQDDWQVAQGFTLNLGVRYDLTRDAFANDFSLPLVMAADRSDDTNNIQPRVGFAWQVNDLTVVRGGSGLYYGDALSTNTMWAIGNTQIATIQVPNDGRPGFRDRTRSTGRRRPTRRPSRGSATTTTTRPAACPSRPPRSRRRGSTRASRSRFRTRSGSSGRWAATSPSRPITSTTRGRTRSWSSRTPT